jgi:hypothetical protein
MARKTSRKAEDSFFEKGSKESDEYSAIREGRNQWLISVRDSIENIWSQCKPYLDPDVRTDARENFHQRWWEIYLTHLLLDADVQLVRREHRQLRKSGPDLLALVDGRKLWIEAVAASAGEGPDAVRSSGPPKAPKPFPEKGIMLRFQQAFSTKVCVHTKYVEKDWVSLSDGYIIALNGALAERGYPCMQRFPRIVNALLLGLETERIVIEFDEEKSRVGQSTYEYQTEVEKKSRAPV